MSAQPSRRLVLSVFKRLHRTTRAVFSGDSAATAAARDKINSDFRENRNVTAEAEIAKLVTLADDAEKIFRSVTLDDFNLWSIAYTVRALKAV